MSSIYSDEAPAMPAVSVHVASIAADAHLVAGDNAAGQQRLRGSYETFLLTANDPVQCILPDDPDREIAWVQAIDHDIVIGTKTQVQNPINQNQGPPVAPQPQGAYLFGAFGWNFPVAPFPVRDSGAVHASLLNPANNVRVSVAAYYRCK